MEQTSLFDIQGIDTTNEDALARYAKSAILDHLGGVCNSSDVSISQTKKHTTITLRGITACRICVRKSQQYLSIPNQRLHGDVQDLKLPTPKADGEYTRLRISSADDFIFSLSFVMASLDDILAAIPPMFSCCNWYMQCSDAHKCVNPIKETALMCSYNRRLKAGIIYYGKNRNIP